MSSQPCDSTVTPFPENPQTTDDFDIISLPSPGSTSSDLPGTPLPSDGCSSLSDFDVLSLDTDSCANSTQSGSESESESELDSDLDSDIGESDESRRANKRRRTDQIGTSSSAQASQRLKKAMADGTLIPNIARVNMFKKTCLEFDELAEFELEKRWRVFHSHCGKWTTMKEAYSTQRFREHVKKCNDERVRQKTSKQRSRDDSNVPQEGLRATTLHRFFSEAPPAQTSMERKSEPESTTAQQGTKRTRTEMILTPCPGITGTHEARVPIYLQRTGAPGGGAPSVTAIARVLYRDAELVFSMLSPEEKQPVYTKQSHQMTWRNNHAAQAVFSSSCEKVVRRTALGLCDACLQVLQSKAFRNAIRIGVPEDKNYKYLNERYRNNSLGQLYARSHGLQDLIEDQVRREILRLGVLCSLTFFAM